MIAGLSGPLLSHDLLERLLDAADDDLLVRGPDRDAARRIRACCMLAHERLGPACAPRQVYDLVAGPLARELGFEPVPLVTGGDLVAARLHVEGHAPAVLVVTRWGQTAAAAWRPVMHHAMAHRARWCINVTGDAVRLFDAERAYARRYAAFDLELAGEDDRTLRALWSVLHASALAGGSDAARLDRIVSRCEAHRAAVGVSLRVGVHAALFRLIAAFRQASRRHARPHLFDESLIVVYRMLFLLFAEARRLVPAWHPVYRESYTIGVLQRRIERRVFTPGIWEALQAMARLAHRGCRAGTLRVPPFNGRLFSPADAPLADTLPLDDHAVGEAILALTVRQGRQGPERISYGDLGVEQLGSVYEHLLDFDVAADGDGPPALVRTGRRKATGSFYTPRPLTEFLVRRTLAPLVSAASPEAILELRVLDPAMGSGAFLVAACRYLATAYEQALVREGARSAGDIDQADRAGFRRLVAQRCLFGVDVNPMAVQLGRLSLWLATLAGDRPLSFFDHHLRAGNSLAGASVPDILRHLPSCRVPRRARDLPLFEGDALQASLESVVAARLAMTRTPDDTLRQVRDKEHTLASIDRPGGPLDRWRSAADLWCSAWYGQDRGVDGRTLRALLDRLLRDDPTLPSRLADPMLARAAAIARSERFFHWAFEFPEAFHDDRGVPLARPGFDAILGNPPWDVLRDGPGAQDARGLAGFVRRSGVYTLQGNGHGNLYHLFLERALRMLKPGGRAGLIVPSGFAVDHACATLRRHVLARTTVDTFTTIDNRDGIFPVHRGLRFLLLTLTAAGATADLPVRSGVRAAAALDAVADEGHDPSSVALPHGLVERMSGASLAIPEIRSSADLEILSRIAFDVPAAEDAAGWQIRFGRELNVTDDRPSFTSTRGLPVLEGKHLRPFAVDTAACRYRIPARDAARRLSPAETFGRTRLAYREVAAATNRLTLIAALVPAGVVTSHTVFCLKTVLDDEAQQFLCGVFNSYVANYLVRLRVGTHVTAAIIARLPVPRPALPNGRYTEIARLSRRLAQAADVETVARLNALVALEYNVSCRQFAHILDTFPLVPQEERRAALDRLKALGPGAS